VESIYVMSLRSHLSFFETILSAASLMTRGPLSFRSLGMGAVKRVFLGSVADYLVHNCSCSVAVVRPSPTKKANATVRIFYLVNCSEYFCDEKSFFFFFFFSACRWLRGLYIVFISPLNVICAITGEKSRSKRTERKMFERRF
jgi:hypothetical protein